MEYSGVYVVACNKLNVVFVDPDPIYENLLTETVPRRVKKKLVWRAQDINLLVCVYVYIIEKALTERMIKPRQRYIWKDMLRLGQIFAFNYLCDTKIEATLSWRAPKMSRFLTKFRRNCDLEREFIITPAIQHLSWYGFSPSYIERLMIVPNLSAKEVVKELEVKGVQHLMFNKTRKKLLHKGFLEQPFHTYKEYVRLYYGKIYGTNLFRVPNCSYKDLNIPYKFDFKTLMYCGNKIHHSCPTTATSLYAYTISTVECLHENIHRNYRFSLDLEYTMKIAKYMYYVPVIIGVPLERFETLKTNCWRCDLWWDYDANTILINTPRARDQVFVKPRDLIVTPMDTFAFIPNYKERFNF